MDRDNSLNASRPVWGGPTSQGTGTWSLSAHNEPSSAQGVSRPAWDETALRVPPGRRNAYISAADKAHIGEEDRVVHHSIYDPGSRPVDFLKLIGLWTIANGRREAEEEFRAEGPTSMAASKTLGRGLSFSVSLVGVEERAQRQLRLRSRFVVYKKLRGLTNDLDVIERGRLLRAVLLEVRVLTHRPLSTHDNIVRLLHLVWEPDPDLPDQAWPVLVLEYAENGTLADFQIDYPTLPFSLKKKLCQDVGRGVLALHSAGVVHGDLKSENVLVCGTGNEGTVVAKLADFGCAVMDLKASDTMALPAFSLPWDAPESRDRLSRDSLRFTDVYSYGLLVWRVTLGGTNPFRDIDSLARLDRADFHQEVRRIKMENLLLPLAIQTLREPFCNIQESHIISGSLACTLQRDTSKRSLNRALEILGEDHRFQPTSIEPMVPYEYHNVEISALTNAVAPMCLQLSVIRELETLSTKPGTTGDLACLNLFELYIERLEWPDATSSAAKWYLRAVESDAAASMARYAFGVFELLQSPVPAGMDPVSILESLVRRGCYHSLMELRRRSPPRFRALRQEYRRHGGLLRREGKHRISGMLPSDNFEDYFARLLAEKECDRPELGEMLVSENGDVLLHAAARYGCPRAIDHLLSLRLAINVTNRDGETALLQACRAGCLESVERLLGKGADPAIPAAKGETPLHWVCAFDDSDIERATHLLLTNRGEAGLHATVAPGDSSAVEYLTLYGTPLHYAILVRNETAARCLLSVGADPFLWYGHERVGSTPFKLAIRELLPDTIKTIISSPVSRPRLGGYLASLNESILHFAIESFGKALCRVAQGAKYVNALIETIDLLRTIEGMERTREFGMSLLHASIVHGLPVQVIRYLLETGCREDLESVSSLHGHTPLQVAMHLNRRDTFLLLLEYGASTARKLRFPEDISYLQFCAYLGPRAVFYAKGLLDHGLTFNEPPRIFISPKSPIEFAPPVYALAMGNFELATFLAKVNGSKHLVHQDVDIYCLLFRFFPRLPLSRLRFLLEPPDGFEPQPLLAPPLLRKTCFHSIVGHPFWGELELISNLRYLLEQSKVRGQQGLLNQLYSFGMTPLDTAVAFGRLDVVGEMLAAGADPELGPMTSLNIAYMYLGHLQKTPSQFLISIGGLPPSRREARWLQDDFKSIIALLKQYGAQEMRRSDGIIKIPYRKYAAVQLEAFQDLYKNIAQEAREEANQMVAQHGPLKALQLTLKERADLKAASPQETSIRPDKVFMNTVRDAVDLYQRELTMRNRFSTTDDPGLQSSGARALGAGSSGIKGKLESLKNFVKLSRSLPAGEIGEIQPEPPTPRLQRQHQGEHQQAAQYSTSSPGPWQLDATRAPRGWTGFPPPPTGHPVPIRHPAQLQNPLPYNPTQPPPKQLASVNTPEFHIHMLTQQLSPLLTGPAPQPGELHARIQLCLDTHFAHAGAGALSQDPSSTLGSPLGSLSVLELESGLNRLLQGRLEVTMLKRDGLLKGILCHPGERSFGTPQRVKGFLDQGWMGWRELEEKEAEMLTF